MIWNIRLMLYTSLIATDVDIVSIIRNGLNFVGVDVFWQNIVFGIVVIAAVAITVDRSGRNIVIK